ncbi:MAG: acetyl-CoA carboxylase carboxyltransferase subunit [Sandaracinaceae bacterium]|nr:acetyl-CoA carboxylase carboxyltransferase subunit [Sandaracinaceae bacterium]
MDTVLPSLEHPFEAKPSEAPTSSPYDRALAQAQSLRERPRKSQGVEAIVRQHQKGRMTVWERIAVLSRETPMVLFENWGPNLDGASLVTAIIRVEGREVACYGHDFTVRAGSMDAANGRKLARLFELAGKRGIPVIGMNDSAGAYVPAGVGGLDGYAEAFTALRKISGVVPSIMCMFGFNAGGGSYLPRQGSFVIQPEGTFFGLTGPAVVKSVLGEEVSPDELGGPSVHGASGVADFTVQDEVAALETAIRILRYIPSNNREAPPYIPTSDPVSRETIDTDLLLRRTFESPTGLNTPFDVSFLIQDLCDYGDYFEVQPQRARNMICAFGRIGGYVVGIVANNSAVDSGQIDVAAAYKAARFIRFCNIYNIPLLFIEDTTGFLPGKEQEAMGIVQAGRALLDAIVDVRTPRILLIVRNAFGGAYACFNNYATGADLVLALPTTRVAVMGPAGKEFVYKEELRAIRAQAKRMNPDEAEAFLREREAEMAARYEEELMNPREALSLGSISRLIMPREMRRVIAEAFDFLMRHYEPGPMQGPQREFH